MSNLSGDFGRGTDASATQLIGYDPYKKHMDALAIIIDDICDQLEEGNLPASIKDTMSFEALWEISELYGEDQRSHLVNLTNLASFSNRAGQFYSAQILEAYKSGQSAPELNDKIKTIATIRDYFLSQSVKAQQDIVPKRDCANI